MNLNIIIALRSGPMLRDPSCRTGMLVTDQEFTQTQVSTINLPPFPAFAEFAAEVGCVPSGVPAHSVRCNIIDTNDGVHNLQITMVLVPSRVPWGVK